MIFFQDIYKFYGKALLSAVAFFVMAHPFVNAQTSFHQNQISVKSITLKTSSKSLSHSFSDNLLQHRNAGKQDISNSGFMLPDKGKKQPSDTAKVKKHSPKAATWMSAVLPGLGQIYNRKYWKLPIIYGGFGALAYFGIRYHGKYVDYRDSYYSKMGVSPDIIDPFPHESENAVLAYRDFYHRNFELTCVIGGLLYILNVVDATVDAHLYKFDVSDDLSFKVEPQITPLSFNTVSSPGNGIKLTVKF
ncbi:MAG: DUF5683 domain-containing protein [Bacteroidota bacterium]